MRIAGEVDLQVQVEAQEVRRGTIRPLKIRTPQDHRSQVVSTVVMIGTLLGAEDGDAIRIEPGQEHEVGQEGVDLSGQTLWLLAVLGCLLRSRGVFFTRREVTEAEKVGEVGGPPLGIVVGQRPGAKEEEEVTEGGEGEGADRRTEVVVVEEEEEVERKKAETTAALE